MIRTIQPVVQKETIQPSVVHTTVPVHEIHENEPKHHAASALPAVSMADFKKQGGSLAGREERYDGFEGEPRAVGSSLGGSPAIGGTTGMSGTSGTGVGHHGSTTAGPHSSNVENRMDPRVGSDMSRGGNTGTGSGYGTTSYGTGNTGHGTHSGTSGNHSGTSGSYDNSTGSSSQKKPSLLDRLNRKRL